MYVKSVGYDDFDGQLKHMCSAHPKVDWKTGEFLVFGYQASKPLIHYSVFDKDRSLVKSFKIPITSSRMIHDFVMTQHYIVIPDLPVELDPAAAVKNNTHLFHYNAKAKTRYGVLGRSEPDSTNIIWFDCPSHYCFHYGNSWDELNDKGETIVVLFAVIYEDFDMDFGNYEHYVLATDKGSIFQRMEFNLSTKQMKTKNLI